MNVPKFNLNWLYMLIAMALLGLYLTNESTTPTKDLSYDEFQQYVRNGYVSKVVGYNDNSIEVYIKPQHVADVFKEDSNSVGKTPVITTKVPSLESMDAFLQKRRTNYTSTALSSTKKRKATSCWLSSGRYCRLHSSSASGFSCLAV